MSKRYSGKSFNDSNVNKKPKLSLKYQNLKGHLLMAFFFKAIKVALCLNDIAANPLKTPVLKKSRN